MKLLTLNTHSLVEDNYPQKLEAFVEGIAAEKPQIIALQEVNQSISAMPAEATEYYHPCCGNAVIKCNNYVYRAAQLLREKGVDLPDDLFTQEELHQHILRLWKEANPV